MSSIVLLLIFSLSISMILIFLNSMLSKKNYLDREKPSPFECGFDMKTFSRMPLSIRFFLIAVIFLIFDVEITLLIPLPMMSFLLNPLISLFILLTFLVILILGILHEWNEGSLQWK